MARARCALIHDGLMARILSPTGKRGDLDILTGKTRILASFQENDHEEPRRFTPNMPPTWNALIIARFEPVGWEPTTY